ncbi:AraC family transcriptional regulator [Actinoplanes aureus]|jgi:AraC-like DNA-binding protein|uniref:AraC family transcriptional regulator n=1 Tax=Actinoplanes aureus TaxID=2792083 RepID=A0A931CEU8_9ACTN|nr:AraC family transcriptional regulator [Actinoplanes aureus]MBG0568595.1 AraC family transcriptional regulator [Actinoplanes aureus]
MDPVGGLLDPRARGAFILRSLLSAPWSIRIEDRAPLTLVAVVRGSAYIDAGTATTEIVPGDVAVVRGPAPYTVADSVATGPQVAIGPDQVCRPIAGVVGARPMGPLGLRSWGNDPDGDTMLLTGTYHSPAEISRSLLSALPDLVVLRPGEWDSGLVEHVIREVDRDAPGQDVVLDRLLDLVLITAVRTWLARPDAHPPRWYTAQDDPIVGAALTCIHARPDQAWTVASLAAEARCSRALLARRFTEMVGVPPMTYLTEWRLSCAADLLLRSDATLEAIARDVGYASPFALSAAFKRVRGVSPRTLRSDTAAQTSRLEGVHQQSWRTRTHKPAM